MEPVVFVHVSDIHFAAADDGTAERHASTRVDLINDMKQMRQTVGDATSILVTGDITYSGAEHEYRVAGEWLDEAAAVAGTDRAKILTVPGNHDVNITKVGPSAELAHQRLRDCSPDDVDKTLEAFLGDPARPLLSKLDDYNKFAARYGCQVPENGRPWEVPVPLGGGYSLAVRGLCSVFNSDRSDRQRLLVGKLQTTLPAVEGKVYFLLAHHGPGDLRDADSVRDKIKDRAAALLTGHRHAQRIRQVDGCVEITAGAVNPEEETGWYPSYNWLRISLVGEERSPRLLLELWHREWKPAWNAFGSGSRDGDVERWEFALPEHAVLSTPPAPPTPSLEATGTSAGDGGAGSDISSATAPDSSAEARAAMEDEHGDVSMERRVRRDLFDLSVPAQYRVLTDCGLIEDEDWAKDYLTMISDALTTAAERQSLERLAEAIRAEIEGVK